MSSYSFKKKIKKNIITLSHSKLQQTVIEKIKLDIFMQWFLFYLLVLLHITVYSHYLKVQGTLWNSSKYLYFNISDLQKWGKNEQPHFTNEYVILLLNLEICWKYCGISTIFCYLLLDFHVKTGTIFSLWDKRLFEISEAEISRVKR